VAEGYDLASEEIRGSTSSTSGANTEGVPHLSIFVGQVWLLVYSDDVVRMKVLSVSPDWVTLAEVPWSEPPPDGRERRVLSTSPGGLVQSGILDDRPERGEITRNDRPPTEAPSFSDDNEETVVTDLLPPTGPPSEPRS
jgi:hypothetical protein